MKQESIFAYLDVKAFAQAASTRSGRNLLSDFERLMHETEGLGADQPLDWSARGELRMDPAGAEQVWLHLRLKTNVPLTCQRCLNPVNISVAENRAYRFVGSEEEAREQDETADEDVLALGQDFNLAALIEDEVLMALPLIGAHETCPVEVKLAVADPGFDTGATEKSNPFAVLAKLKGGKSS
jgi:uncharacterized protein